MKKRNFILRIFDYKMWLYDFAKITGALPILLDLRMKKYYLNDKKNKKLYSGRYIISANHTGLYDPIIVSAAFLMRRVGFVATSILFNNKFTNFLFRHFGCVPIDKDNPSIKSFKMVTEHLDRGHIMCVFPGGTIAHEKNDDIGIFKSGIVMMAIMSNSDILPVYIPRRENRLKRQKIMIGEKINCKNLYDGTFPSMDDINRITNLLLEKELELKNKYNERVKK